MSQTDSRQLRKVLGCYATGVTVITTRTRTNSRIGVTVNSFASVSLDPPLILFSLARTANVLASFQEAGDIAVNILSRGQQTLSNMFAKPSSAVWTEADHFCADNGCALFKSSLAHLECRKRSEIDGGDHLIFLCEVIRFHLQETTDPLLFYRGAYGTHVRDPWSKMPQPDSSLAELAVGGWG